MKFSDFVYLATILQISFTKILANERFKIRLCRPKGRDFELDMSPTSSLAHIPPAFDSLNGKCWHSFSLWVRHFKAIWCYQSMPGKKGNHRLVMESRIFCDRKLPRVNWKVSSFYHLLAVWCLIGFPFIFIVEPAHSNWRCHSLLQNCPISTIPIRNCFWLWHSVFPPHLGVKCLSPKQTNRQSARQISLSIEHGNEIKQFENILFLSFNSFRKFCYFYSEDKLIFEFPICSNLIPNFQRCHRNNWHYDWELDDHCTQRVWLFFLVNLV